MSKPGGCHSSGISLGDALRLPKRHGGGAKLNLALVRNVRTWPAMLKEKAQAAPTARPRVLMRRRGADCLVVVRHRLCRPTANETLVSHCRLVGIELRRRVCFFVVLKSPPLVGDQSPMSGIAARRARERGDSGGGPHARPRLSRQTLLLTAPRRSAIL